MNEFLIIIVELAVLLFLIWHIRELAKNSREMHQTVNEMHKTHKEMHRDTKLIRDAVQNLEKDMNALKGKKQ